MCRPLLFIVFTCLQALAVAQQDSVKVPDDMKDGFYLTYADFRRNRAIEKEAVVTEMDRDQLEFMGKLMNQEKIVYRRDGAVQSVDPRIIWGFFQNKTLYVNYKEEFYRVPVFGSICYLVASVTIYSGGFYDPTFGYVVTPGRGKEIREFIMNYYDGEITELKSGRVEELLSRDAALYAEYKALSRRRQREQLYRYIRRFNESHPVYFLR